MSNDPILWPSHAYIPGSNKRHAADAFDAIRATATDEQTPGQLASSAAFQHGLLYLDRGYYWEAHEVLEAVWLALPPDSDEKRFVQGLIQLANACLKQQMQRPNAVRRLCEISRDLFQALPPGQHMDKDVSAYLKQLDALEAKNMTI
ncbi:MAG: DUF309 domain-containing protein [Granulosicoccus sp.]